MKNPPGFDQSFIVEVSPWCLSLKDKFTQEWKFSQKNSVAAFS